MLRDCWRGGDLCPCIATGSEGSSSRQLAAAFCVLHSIDFTATCPPSAAAVPDRMKADQNNIARGMHLHKESPMVAAMPSAITAIAKRSDGPPGSMIQSAQPLATVWASIAVAQKKPPTLEPSVGPGRFPVMR